MDRLYWRYRKNGMYLSKHNGPPTKAELGSATPRAWADFRDYADVGGKREPLVPKGSRYATDDPDLAEAIAAERVRELKRKRVMGEVADVTNPQSLGEFASHHLTKKARVEDVTTQWLKAVEMHLAAAKEFFGSRTDLTAIKVSDVEDWIVALRERPAEEGGPLSDGSIRKYINSVSNLYRRAQAEEVVPPGFNPVAALGTKPTAKRKEAKWLEVPTAAALLEAARLEEPDPELDELPFPYELVGTFLLTGGRKSEVLGLTVSDLDFVRRTVTFRPNERRRLKTSTAHRVVPMPTQLVEILRPYVLGEEPRIGLLFPSPRTGKMVTDTRKLLDRLAARIGLEDGEVRLHGLRHTFCAAALQTMDRGKPISKYTVAMWMGHGGTSLVDRIYGHLGEHRHRGEEVAFRVEHHLDALEEDVLRELRLAG